MLEITEHGSDLLVNLKVVPKSSRDRVVGELAGALKVAVAAAPEHGAANKAVCALLAKALGLRSNQVVIESGHGSPRKIARISGSTRAAVLALIKER